MYEIGNQSRPKIFDLAITRPELLYEDVVEADERVQVLREENKVELGLDPYKSKPGREAFVLPPEAKGITGEWCRILKPLDEKKLRVDLQRVYDKGIRSLAICLMHSYTIVAHEERVGTIAKEIGFTHVSLSSRIMPMVKIVPRGFTSCADAYLTPAIYRYIDTFVSGFDAVSFVQGSS